MPSGAVQDHHYSKRRRPGHSHQYSDAQMKVRAGCCIRNFVVRHEGCSTDLTRDEIKIAISAVSWTRDMITTNTDVIRSHTDIKNVS